MRIGELASRTGESVKTLRYWSERGLLETARGDNGYRLYAEASLSRVSFIRSAQRLGFTVIEFSEQRGNAARLAWARRLSGCEPVGEGHLYFAAQRRSARRL